MFSIKEYSQYEIIINKSKFICHLMPTLNSSEANEFISDIKSKYKDARHNCVASITEDGRNAKISDDGEPSNTAGKPMLDILQKNNLVNITAVVTRYFGGIKLGAGGLIRAYSSSVKEALNNTNIYQIVTYKIYEITLTYQELNKFEHIDFNYIEINKEFNEKINIQVGLNEVNYQLELKKLTDQLPHVSIIDLKQDKRALE